jgi:hypothetical protein
LPTDQLSEPKVRRTQPRCADSTASAAGFARIAFHVSPQRTIACASANLHENFFGKTFIIGGSDGNPVFTGCAAWGLERLVLALFTQHGFDKARWPESLRSDVWS